MPDPYELAPEPISPDLPGEVVVSVTEDDLIDAAAADLFMQAVNCVRMFGDFHLALTGGRLQEKLCIRLMVDPKFRSLPWTRTQLWVASEGRVGDEPGGRQIVDEVLRDHAGIPRAQIHLMPRGEDGPEAYEKELLEALGWRERGQDRLDFVLAGMDSDGSVSGIGAGEDLCGGRAVTVYRGGLRGDRMSMTPWFLSGVRFLALLVGGEQQRDVVARLVKERSGPGLLTDTRPLAGVCRWYLDRAAAGV